MLMLSVVPPTATHPRIIGQHPPQAFQHQNLGPPAGFEVQPAALRPGINVQTRTQGQSSSDTPLNLEEGPSSASQAVIPELEKGDIILQCFESGLTADQALKEIVQLKGTKWTSLSTIKRSYEKFWSGFFFIF
uniref:Uncharacterized protein n=1 Tax=Meloidogyne enterolobii TaxID=390850 RepID=A0A6V7U4X9_MELEN|nr:unnamed protein product [Meloidogyne enterolobii]